MVKREEAVVDGGVFKLGEGLVGGAAGVKWWVSYSSLHKMERGQVHLSVGIVCKVYLVLFL